MKKIKKRNYAMVLYPDEDQTHKNALDYIVSHYNHCYICHDKDFDENGELKKPHYHVVITFNNARYLESITKQIGLQSNYIEPIIDLNSYLLYLIHYENPEKYQYSINDVKGPLSSKISRIIKKSDKDEEDQYADLLSYIKSKDYISLFDLSNYALENGYINLFRKSSYLFNALINEHNNINVENKKSV